MENIIKIGNQTACNASRLFDPFEYAVRSEFKAFEWFPDKKRVQGWDEKDVSGESLENIRKTGLKYGIDYSLHLNNAATIFRDDFDYFASSGTEFARNIGASKIICHFEHMKGIEFFIHGISKLIELTHENNLRLFIENVPSTGPDDFNMLFEYLYQVSNKIPVNHIGMCFDVGHANIHSNTQNDYIRYLDILDPDIHIGHFHLHKNSGQEDSHQILYKDPDGFETGIGILLFRIIKRGFTGNIIMEHWSEDTNDLFLEYSAVRKMILNLFTG